MFIVNSFTFVCELDPANQKNYENNVSNFFHDHLNEILSGEIPDIISYMPEIESSFLGSTFFSISLKTEIEINDDIMNNINLSVKERDIERAISDYLEKNNYFCRVLNNSDDKEIDSIKIGVEFLI